MPIPTDQPGPFQGQPIPGPPGPDPFLFYTLFFRKKSVKVLVYLALFEYYFEALILLHIYCYITSNLMLFSKPELVVGSSAAGYIKKKRSTGGERPSIRLPVFWFIRLMKWRASSAISFRRPCKAWHSN